MNTNLESCPSQRRIQAFSQSNLILPQNIQTNVIQIKSNRFNSPVKSVQSVDGGSSKKDTIRNNIRNRKNSRITSLNVDNFEKNISAQKSSILGSAKKYQDSIYSELEEEKEEKLSNFEGKKLDFAQRIEENEESEKKIEIIPSENSKEIIVINDKKTQKPDETTKNEIQVKHCRICLGEDLMDQNVQEWVAPCKCLGGGKYIHNDCLKQWITTRYVSEQKIYACNYRQEKIRCEICKCAYEIETFHKMKFNPKSLMENEKQQGSLKEFALWFLVLGIIGFFVQYVGRSVSQEDQDAMIFIYILLGITVSLIIFNGAVNIYEALWEKLNVDWKVKNFQEREKKEENDEVLC